MSRNEKKRVSDSGFTLIEVLVAILIMVLGFLALFHLQSGVLKATNNSWNVVTATHLAEHFLETIRLEALEWNNDTTRSTNQSQFQFLKNIPSDGSGTGWIRAYVTGSQFEMSNQLGKAFGIGREYDTGALNEFPNNRGQRFCVQYRLTWLVPRFLIRVEVRVFWPKDDAEAGRFNSCPDGTEGGVGIQDDPTNAWGVTFTTTVMKNVFVST